MIKVVGGNVTTNSLNYTITATSTAFNTGDLIRITAAGTIELADASGAGAVHGIALGDSSDYSAGDKIPVGLFDNSTILAVPCASSFAPDDLTVGLSYTITPTTKAQALTTTTTNGIMLIVGKQGDDTWFDPDVDDAVTTGDGNSIYCMITQANLDGRIAATT